MRILEVSKKTFNLTKINSPFVDELVEADFYYLLRNDNKIVGGYAYTVLENGYIELQGVFKKDKSVKNLFAFIKNYLADKKIVLYCFEALIPLYSRYGFKEVERYPFNEQLAPSNWNIKELGRQAVIKMVA